MGFLLTLGLGVVAGVFILIVTGEVFYLFHWRKRPLYPRGNSVPVAPVTETEGGAVGTRQSAETSGEVFIDVQCAEYQIATLHQDLVEKLFPAVGVASPESAQDLMGQTRMLFTITEETKEELERLDLDHRRSRRASRSKSMSDISLSPVGPLSPLSSTPFITPSSSPDHFVTPYGTPIYSPLVALNRSLTASPILVKTPSRIVTDHLNGSPPVGPPSPTRPSFPFLSRGNSPSQSPDFPPVINLEASEWRSPQYSRKLSPNNATTFYSPPRKPFVFATPVIHGKHVEGLVKVTSPLRSCTYVYENNTSSPSSQASPHSSTLGDHFTRENQELKNLPASTPPHLSPTSVGPAAHFFSSHCSSPSDTSVSTSPSYKPSSQRSSSVLFPSSIPRPPLTVAPVLADGSPIKSIPGTGSSSPTESTTSLSSSWDSMCTPFIVESSHSSAHQSVSTSTHTSFPFTASLTNLLRAR